MRKINPTCSSKDSLKYSILIGLHCSDIKNHSEKI